MSKNCQLSARVGPLVFVIGAWSSNLYGLHIAEPDSSNRVRGLDDLSNTLVGEAVLCAAAQAAAFSSARRDRSVFPFTIMMPRGPGILSVREA